MNAMDGTRSCMLAILLAASCRTDRNATTEPKGATHRLLATPGAMDGWQCKLEISSRFHAGPFKGNERVTEIELALAPTPERELALHVRELSTRVVTRTKVMTLEIDGERVLRSSPERREALRKDENAEARALIDALLAAPHAFVAYDEHARLTAHRSDFEQLDQLLPVLGTLELAWIFVYPSLPGKIAIGQRWWGKRAPPPTDASRATYGDVEIAYTLRGVRDDVATIEFGGGSQEDSPSGLDFIYDVAGAARVRASDGALLAGTADTTVAFAVDDGSRMGVRARFTTECRPPK